MEVHHPHHSEHKKKWSELLLEFFMLFLAVTLGFFAENIRETIADKHKKQEQLEAVVRDLNTDIAEIQRHRILIKRRYENCNNYLKLLDTDYRKIDKLDFYRIGGWHAESKDLILNEMTHELWDPKLVQKSDFIWMPNPVTNDPDFQGKLKKPIDQKIKNKIIFNIVTKRQLIMIELNDIDSLDKYAKMAIKKINSQYGEN